MLARLKSRQAEHHYWGLSTAIKPTVSVPFNSTYYETDKATWYVFTGAGWLAETTGADSNISRLIQVSVQTISITIVNVALSQTDVITIDGIAVGYVSDATPTKKEISDGLIADFAVHFTPGLATTGFVISQGAGPNFDIILTPAGITEPVVAVSANLTLAAPTDGFARINRTAGARLDAIYFDAALNGVVTIADAGVVKAILPIATPAAGVKFYGAKFLTRLEVKIDNIADLGTVVWRDL